MCSNIVDAFLWIRAGRVTTLAERLLLCAV